MHLRRILVRQTALFTAITLPWCLTIYGYGIHGKVFIETFWVHNIYLWTVDFPGNKFVRGC